MHTLTASQPVPMTRRASELFAQYQHDVHTHTDRLFAGLMGFQWVAGIIFALWVSPLTWYGPVSRTHLHVWAAIVVGGAICGLPAVLGIVRPGAPSTRYTIAVAQMLMGALLIHLSGGRIETHFHVFGSLAFLAFYRDWRVLIPATIVVALDHLLRGLFWPQSVYGILVASQWRWLEHASWVAFEDVFLVVACRRAFAGMQDTAIRTATLEQEVRTRQEAETDARNSRARNHAILDVALDGVILMDEAGRIVQFNPAAERTFGYREAEALGHPLADLVFPAAKREAHRTALVGSLKSGEAGALNRRLELTAVRKGGEEFPVEMAIAPISTEGTAMFAGYMRDITERRRNEAALSEYTREIEQAHNTERQNAEQLATLVGQLRVTQTQAEAATRAKSEFLASMSHELRTPLNAIILYSELLQEEAQGKGLSGSFDDLQRIKSAGNHLLELINGILDLSKIEAGKMSLCLDRFDIARMVRELVDTVGSLAQANKNTLTVHCAEDLGMMYADVMKTRQILLNLLGNAAKFTRQGAITLDVRRGAIGATPAVVFSVTDTGLGMTLEQTGRIFDAFTQADITTTREYGGTGLGLAIVSRFCELMGGSVSVASQPERGSAFTVLLPLEVAVSGHPVPQGVA